MKKLRVLLITREPWRDDSNEGSVLSGWFEDQPMELAQIYCKPGAPQNRCCERTFQLTDRMALENLLRRTPMGRCVSPADGVSDAPAAADAENKSFYDFFRKNNWAGFHLFRECLWSLANWKSEALERFVDDFSPDVVFAPLCYNRYVMDIQRWAAKRAGAPMVGVIWDDLYSLRQWRFSPLYWLNRMMQRSCVRKTASDCRYLYALCDEQARVFAKQLGCEVRALPKAEAVCAAPAQDAGLRDGVRLIYAGGVYYGRMKTLQRIVEALKKLNAKGLRCRLDVFTSSPGTEALKADGVCDVHPTISMERLRREYASSQIALHVEGFDRRNAWLTQYSFSAKIVDCLASGCAVLAACPSVNLGLQYLRAQDAAVCVDESGRLEEAAERLVSDAGYRRDYARKAVACVETKHAPAPIRRQLLGDLSNAAPKR